MIHGARVAVWQCGSTQIQAKYKPTSASTMNVDLMVINLQKQIYTNETELWSIDDKIN